MFGSEGLLTYEGDDQRESSGRLCVTRRDGGAPTVVDGFLFENYEAEGTGPESLQALVDACNGEEIYVGVDAQIGLQVVKALSMRCTGVRGAARRARRRPVA